MDSGTGTTVPHILILEDDTAIQDLVLRAFRKDPDQLRVSVAGTIHDARDIVGRDPPDLIIADWMLPDGKGIEILPRRDGVVTVPLVIMTSHGDEALAVEIMKSGAIDYVVKSATVIRDLPHIARRALHDWENIRQRKEAEEAVRESEERYRGVFENTGTATVIVEEDTTICLANDEFCRLSGCRKEEIEGRRQWTEFVVPEDLDRMLTQHRLRRKQLQEALRHYEFRFITKANQIRDIYLTIDVIRGTKRSVASLLDITERKAAEKLLRESEKKFHDTVLNLDEAFYSCTPEGVLLEHNPAFNRILGFDPGQDLRGTHLPDFWQREHDRQKYLNELVNTGFVRNFFIDAKRHSGEKLVVMANSHVVKDEKGMPVRIDGTFFDITEQKLAEEELQKTVLFLTSMIEQSPVPMWISDDNGTLLKLNKACCDLLNITEDDVVGKYNVLKDNIVEEQGLLPLVKSVFEKGQTAKFEIKYDSSQLKHLALKKTAFVILDVTIFPIKDPDGRITNAVIQHNDITNRKRAEEALKKSQIQLAEAMDLAHLVNWEFDVLTGIFTFDDRFYALYGTTAEREGGNKIPADVYSREFVHPDDQNVVADEVNKALQTTDPDYTSEVEHRIIRRDGDVRHIVVHIGITKDAQGRTIKTHGANQDITERKKAEEALRESNERYRTLSEASPDQIFIIGKDDTLKYANAAVLNLFRLPYDQVIGKSRKDLFPPEIAKSQEVSLQKVFDTGERVRMEERIQFGEQEFWIDINQVPLKDEAGNVTSVLGIARDITERKQAEKSLQESEERYRSVVEDQSEFICRFTPDGRITFVNDAYCRYFSLDKIQCIAKPHSVILSPEDARLMKRHLASLTQENPVAIIEHRIIMPSGEIRWQRWSDRAIFDKDGRLVEYQSVGRDTTEKKQAEEALRDSEMRYRSVIENAAEGIVVVQDGIVQYANTRALKMIDSSPEEIGNQQFTGFIHPEDQALVFDRYQRRIRGENVPQNYDFRIVGKSGQITWVQVSAVQISWNNRPATLNFLTDITDRKLMEAEIRSLNRVLEQRVVDRTGQLNAMLTEKELLLREIHHRVKNNLQIIVSLFNLQSRYISDQKVLDVIRESQNRVRAMALVHERIYRSENVASVDLKEYLTFLGEQVFHYHGVKPSKVTLSLTMPEIRLDVDTVIPLGLVVNELLSNSLKHAFPDGRKGTISILFSTCDEDISLVFSDDGVGFPAGLDWKNSPSLGLRLVISLVRQLNGKIELDPSPGTTFRITATRLQPRIK